MKDPKTLLNPLRSWLLSQGKCIGCGRELSRGKKRTKDKVTIITCSCRRTFMFNAAIGSYRLFQDSFLPNYINNEGDQEDERFLSGYNY